MQGCGHGQSWQPAIIGGNDFRVEVTPPIMAMYHPKIFPMPSMALSLPSPTKICC